MGRDGQVVYCSSSPPSARGGVGCRRSTAVWDGVGGRDIPRTGWRSLGLPAPDVSTLL